MKKVTGNSCARKVWASLARIAGLWRDVYAWRDRAVQPDAMVAFVLLLALSKDIQQNAEPAHSIAGA